eukprot:s735_g28.t1
MSFRGSLVSVPSLSTVIAVSCAAFVRFDGGIFGPSKNHLIVVVMSAKRRGQEVKMARRSGWPGVGLAIPLLLTLQSTLPAIPWGRSLVSFPEAVKKVSASAVHAVLPEAELLGKPHLIGFYAEQSMEAKRMRFLGDLLEKELPGTKIVWLEAWDNPLNERLRATIDLRNQCGGVPYLFNRKTGKVLCGVVAYDKLRAWAQGLGGDARIYRDLGE